jgi:UDP-N-acetylmuramate--alanine ligase
LYFIGIGGIGMSALARVFHHYGYTVKGSDNYDSQVVRELIREGIDVTIGHSNQPKNVDVVIYSSAICEDNPEYLWFRQAQVPFVHRGKLLAYLMNGKRSVAVTGTHGKTTTSSLISFLSRECALDPTALVGGYIINYDSNVILGRRDFIVAEVDESDKSQLYYSPAVSVITNLEEDHLENYHDMNGILAAFKEYLSNLEPQATVIYCGDDTMLSDLVTHEHSCRISYGKSQSFDYQARNIDVRAHETFFNLYKKGAYVADVVIPLIGEHNAVNTLAAFAALELLGAGLEQAIAAIKKFKGVRRRMEILYSDDDLTVIDDYAHHPTEINMVLTTLQKKKRRIIAVFQPHRYTRTLHLMEEFKSAFNFSDMLVLTDIYSAGDTPIEGVTIEALAAAVRTVYQKPCYVVPLNGINDFLRKKIAKRDIVAFLGAGNITDIAHSFAEDRKRVPLTAEMV